MFSANLVTESILPFADCLGREKNYDGQVELMQGKILEVPILKECPLSYELEVKKTIPLNGSDIFICRIRNTLASNAILVDTKHYDLKKSDSVLVSQNSYFGLDKNKNLGRWK